MESRGRPELESPPILRSACEAMKREGPLARIRRHLEQGRFQPDINRALRATLYWNLPIEVSFAAIAAQNIAMVDVRGSYSLRFTLLLAMSAIFAACAWFGCMGATSLELSLATILIVTLASGAWRHLSPDYGMSLATTSIFLTLLALVGPGGEAQASRHFLSALAGGMWGVLVQVALWPVRAQHPLRRVVSDSWLALSDLLAAMEPAEGSRPEARLRLITEREAQLRTTLDQTTAALTAQTGRRRAHHEQLE